MADLIGHKAGNRGHSQGKPTEPIGTPLLGERLVESRTGAVTVVSRWLLTEAFASPPQSGLAWFCFLFPLIGRVEVWRRVP